MTRKLTLILLASNVAAIDAVLANATIGDSGNGEHDTQQAHATGTVGANATIDDVVNGENGTQLATATGVVGADSDRTQVAEQGGEQSGCLSPSVAEAQGGSPPVVEAPGNGAASVDDNGNGENADAEDDVISLESDAEGLCVVEESIFRETNDKWNELQRQLPLRKRLMQDMLANLQGLNAMDHVIERNFPKRLRMVGEGHTSMIAVNGLATTVSGNLGHRDCGVVPQGADAAPPPSSTAAGDIPRTPVDRAPRVDSEPRAARRLRGPPLNRPTSITEEEWEALMANMPPLFDDDRTS